jgi:hypothetical protein
MKPSTTTEKQMIEEPSLMLKFYTGALHRRARRQSGQRSGKFPTKFDWAAGHPTNQTKQTEKFSLEASALASARPQI